MMQHLKAVFDKKYFKNIKYKQLILLSSFFLVAMILRFPNLDNELSNLLYCDESIYLNEIVRMVNEGSFTTGSFLSGSLNYILLIPVFKIISIFYPSISTDEILIIVRLLLPIILSSLTVFLIYLLSKLVTSNKRIPKIASFLYAIAAYPISQSHIYYPDSYSVFFGVLIIYSIIKYYQSQKPNVLFMSFTLSLGLSVKYTFVCFFLTAIIVILIKTFINHKRIIDILITILNLILLTIVFFILINYSIFFHPLNFFFDFAVNIANYDRPVAGGVSTYLFYLLSLTLIPVGISGLILVLVGVYFSIKKNLFRTNTLILIFPGLFFLILMSSGNLAGVRNMNLLLYIPFIFFAFALNELFEIKLVLGRYLAVLILIITASQTLYFTAQSHRKDARLQAAEWVNRNIAKNEKIGTNPGCGYKLPIDEEYEVIFDQDMKGNYNYYIFDMNWANTVFYSEYSKNSWYLEFNPDYISFYHWHNILPSKIFVFKGIQRDIKRHVPNGYGYKLVSGYGPDVIILFRV